MIDIDTVTFNTEGLIPVIVQSNNTNQVLMLAYMNKKALTRTIKTKVAHYFSRSRQSLWKKGETSGHIQYVKEMRLDCDQDTILLRVDQTGVACHTGQPSCFFETLYSEKKDVLRELYDVIQNRKLYPKEGSYTNYLFDEGIDKILKKVGEETSEVIIGAKNNAKDEVIYEVADLVYHTLVLLIEQGVSLEEIKTELKKRRPS